MNRTLWWPHRIVEDDFEPEISDGQVPINAASPLFFRAITRVELNALFFTGSTRRELPGLHKRARVQYWIRSPLRAEVHRSTRNFRKLVSRNPEEPFGEAAVAASYLFEELYRQNVLTIDFSWTKRNS
jgi:hypothetical protein